MAEPELRRRDWPVITLLFAAITLVFVISLWINAQQDARREDDLREFAVQATRDAERDARLAYEFACDFTNGARQRVTETDDALADLLEGLRPLVTNPDTAALADEVIARLRVDRGMLDCTYPPREGN